MIFSNGMYLNQIGDKQKPTKFVGLLVKFVGWRKSDNDCSLPKRKKQMAKELRYSLTTSADRRTTTPTLYVCVAYKGSSTGRKYFIVQGLISPDFTHWNKAKQRFNSGTYTATDNNPKLEELCELCDKLLENSAITSPKKFVEALERNEAPPAETLGISSVS